MVRSAGSNPGGSITWGRDSSLATLVTSVLGANAAGTTFVPGSNPGGSINDTGP
jgi:hypothetical protein